MGVHEFACLIPITGSVMLPSKICSDVSVYAGTKRKAPDVDYAKSPCCNSPVAKKKTKTNEFYKKAVEEEVQKTKVAYQLLAQKHIKFSQIFSEALSRYASEVGDI